MASAPVKRCTHEQEGVGQMVVTMQETFAGIRVIKSFAREDHQEKAFRRSNHVAVLKCDAHDQGDGGGWTD